MKRKSELLWVIIAGIHSLMAEASVVDHGFLLVQVHVGFEVGCVKFLNDRDGIYPNTHSSP